MQVFQTCPKGQALAAVNCGEGSGEGGDGVHKHRRVHIAARCNCDDCIATDRFGVIQCRRQSDSAARFNHDPQRGKRSSHRPAAVVIADHDTRTAQALQDRKCQVARLRGDNRVAD